MGIKLAFDDKDAFWIGVVDPPKPIKHARSPRRLSPESFGFQRAVLVVESSSLLIAVAKDDRRAAGDLRTEQVADLGVR